MLVFPIVHNSLKAFHPEHNYTLKKEGNFNKRGTKSCCSVKHMDVLTELDMVHTLRRLFLLATHGTAMKNTP